MHRIKFNFLNLHLNLNNSYIIAIQTKYQRYQLLFYNIILSNIVSLIKNK